MKQLTTTTTTDNPTTNKLGISIFDLQEGRIYKATWNGETVGKTFRKRNGTLESADGGNLAVYAGCSWTPVKADVVFHDIGADEAAPVKIYNIQEGLAYSVPTGFMESTIVTRVGNRVYDYSDNRLGNEITLDRLSTQANFTPVGKAYTGPIDVSGNPVDESLQLGESEGKDGSSGFAAAVKLKVRAKAVKSRRSSRGKKAAKRK